MGQVASCCVSCCPCPSRRKNSPAALPEGAGGDKLELLSSSRKARKEHFKTSSKLRRPPSHLRELVGDVNQVVRLVLVGSCDTGKTCLLRRFLGGYFDEGEEQQDYTRTLGVDFGCKTVELADHRVRLQMWDTGGSEAYRSVVSHYLRGADGIVLCFDVNRKRSLRELRSTWAPYLDNHMPAACRVLIAGNKSDCRGQGEEEEDTEVSREEAKRFADAIDAQMFETSAKLGTNVDLAVLALVREVLHHRKYAAQLVEETGDEGSSVTRVGRKRLSESLRDFEGEASDEGTTLSRGAHRGERKLTAKLLPPSRTAPLVEDEGGKKQNAGSSQTSSSDESAARGTYSTGSSSATIKGGDSDQDNGGAGEFGWAWTRSSPSGGQGTTNADGGHRGGGDSSGGRGDPKGASDKGGSEASHRNSSSGGPHLVRQLVIAPTSRRPSSGNDRVGSGGGSDKGYHQTGQGEESKETSIHDEDGLSEPTTIPSVVREKSARPVNSAEHDVSMTAAADPHGMTADIIGVGINPSRPLHANGLKSLLEKPSTEQRPPTRQRLQRTSGQKPSGGGSVCTAATISASSSFSDVFIGEDYSNVRLASIVADGE